MKISWGIKIIISFAVFAAGIILMVAISISNSTDLVSENYYEQEIKYQERIDMLSNSISLNENITVETDNENVVIRLNNGNVKDLEGKIHFYRTSDAAKDFEVNFIPSEQGILKVPSEKLDKGIWKIKMFLSDKNQNYFVEKSIFID